MENMTVESFKKKALEGLKELLRSTAHALEGDGLQYGRHAAALSLVERMAAGDDAAAITAKRFVSYFQTLARTREEESKAARVIVDFLDQELAKLIVLEGEPE